MRLTTTRAGLALAGLMTLLQATSPSALAAQRARPTIIVLPETFIDVDARVALVRQRSRDVVLLNPAEATPEALGVGLMLLRRLRRENPSPQTGQLVPVTGFDVRRQLPVSQRRRVESALARLREQPATEVGSLGPGRWIRFGR